MTSSIKHYAIDDRYYCTRKKPIFIFWRGEFNMFCKEAFLNRILIDREIMMKKLIHGSTYFFLSLMILSLNLAAKNELSDLQTVAQTVKELGYYFGSTLQFHAALTIFSQKNNAIIPDITCMFCPKRSLPCDELLVKIQAKSIDKSISKSNSEAHEIRKNLLAIYEEITNMLYAESLDSIRACMVRIARDGEIQCEDCQKIAWTTLGVDKKDLCANDLQKVQKDNNSQ